MGVNVLGWDTRLSDFQILGVLKRGIARRATPTLPHKRKPATKLAGTRSGIEFFSLKTEA